MYVSDGTVSLTSQVLTSTDEIEMWGDGKQTRSFTFIDDCVEGILRITKSDFTEVCRVEGSDDAPPYLALAASLICG